MEGIGRLGPSVGVYRHRHDRGTRLPAEKVEVKEVEPGVFPGDGGIEMMRHWLEITLPLLRPGLLRPVVHDGILTSLRTIGTPAVGLAPSVASVSSVELTRSPTPRRP